MNRRGDFSLMYEVVGILIFGIVSLVWFGGIESIFGGLTTNKAVDAFNQLTNAVKSQCLGGAPVTLTGLDLNNYGSTYIITQIRVPPNLDAYTSGTIQPAMKKCVGADCLCLLKLNELEDNWQMCTTSDWDSYNLAFGGILGAPGCPFWYYAPPSVVEQSIQDLFDFLNIDVLQVLLAATPWFGNQDPVEHFSFPAPELWGGCSYANQDNITISNFSDFHTIFDCSSLSGKLLKNYFKNSDSVIYDLKNKINIDFNVDSNSFINSLKDLSESTDMAILNYFVNIIDKEKGNDYNDIIRKFSYNGINSSPFSQGIKDSIDNLLFFMGVDNGDKINECKENVYDTIKSSFNKEYENYDLLSSGEKGYKDIYGNIQLNVSFTPPFKENINGFNISFIAKNETLLTPVLDVKIGNCEKSINIVGNDYKKYDVYFSSSCISNIVYFSEAFGSNDRVVRIKTAERGLISQEYDGSQWSDSDDLLVNITFDKKYKNPLKVYIETTIASNLTNQAFENAYVDGNPVSREDYKKDISDALVNMDFSDYNNVIHNNYLNNYEDYFDAILNKPIFGEDEQGKCTQIFDPVNDIKKSYKNINDKTINNLNNYFNDKVNELPELKLNFSQVNPNQDYEFKRINTSIKEFSRNLGNQQLPYIKNALTKCLGYDIGDNYDDMIVGNYTKILNKTLTNDSDYLINDVKEYTQLINPELFPVSFSFKDNFKNYILGVLYNSTRKLFDSFDFTIRSNVLSASNYVSKGLSSEVSKYWKNRPIYPVDCWPKVGGGYFKGYPAVNDLLGWRKYTSVSRLTPMFVSFELKGANFFVSKYTSTIEGSLFKKIDNSIYTSIKKGTSTKLLRLTADRLYDVYGFFKKIPNFKITGFSVFNPITGNSIITKAFGKLFLKEGTEIALKKVFLNFLKNNVKSIVKIVAGTSLSIGLNMWRYSVLTSVNENKVVYANGGIRTFNPQLVEVKSCKRMDELGCSPSSSVWVNESYYCNTDMYVRRILNPNTWFNYLKGNDKCSFATHGDEACIEKWNSSSASCYKDTLTICYKLSCNNTGSVESSNGDRYHIFQYWIGANSDPAGILGTQSGKIQALKVYNASKLGSNFNNVIMLEVIGGNASSGLPASIV